MRLGVLLLALAIPVTGCGSSGPTTKSAPTRAKSAPIRAPKGAPYQLYTHCGIQWAPIDGTFWRATRMLSDGNGNPPAGWGNPYQAGTLTRLSARTAVFSSRAGNVVFHRTALRRPPFLCA